MLTLSIAAAGVLVYAIAQPDPADYRVDESLVVYRAEVPSVRPPRIEDVFSGIGRWVVQGVPGDDITLATYDSHRVPEELNFARRDGVDTAEVWRDLFKPNFVWHVSRENATVTFAGAAGWDPDEPVLEIKELSDQSVRTRVRLQDRIGYKTKPEWWPRLERGGKGLPWYGRVVPMHEAMWYVLVGGKNRSSTDMFGTLTSYKGPLRLVIRDISDMSVTRLAVIELPSDTPNVGMNVSFSKDAQWAIASDAYHHIWIIPLAEMWEAFEAAAAGEGKFRPLPVEITDNYKPDLGPLPPPCELCSTASLRSEPENGALSIADFTITNATQLFQSVYYGITITANNNGGSVISQYYSLNHGPVDILPGDTVSDSITFPISLQPSDTNSSPAVRISFVIYSVDANGAVDIFENVDSHFTISVPGLECINCPTNPIVPNQPRSITYRVTNHFAVPLENVQLRIGSLGDSLLIEGEYSHTATIGTLQPLSSADVTVAVVGDDDVLSTRLQHGC